MIAIWFHVLHAGHLVVMALQRLVALEFLFLIQFPKLDCHVSRATRHALTIRIKAYVVYHARMLSKSLFDLARLIVPYLYGSILAGGSKLVVDWMENAPGDPRSMSHHL